MHDVLPVAITVATILIASFFNQSAINALRIEMNSMRTELTTKIDAVQRELTGRIDGVQRELGVVQRDMREFYAEQARHDTRVAALERASENR